MPVVYFNPAHGRDVLLIAFSTTGTVIADTLVTEGGSPETTGGSSYPDDVLECQLATQHTIVVPFFCPITVLMFGVGTPFDGDDAKGGWRPPLQPGVAIRPGSTQIFHGVPAMAPVVMMTDGKQDKIAYAFSPESGFTQVARSTHTVRTFTTPPVVQDNGTTVTGTRDGYITFTDRNFRQLPAVGGLGTLTAAPTRLVDGRLVVLSREGRISVVSGGEITWQSQFSGQTIASAAASCTHFFVSTTDEFVTLNVKTLLPVAKVRWVGGGLSAPVIGAGGHVYAIASDSLFVFPPQQSPFALNACDRAKLDGAGSGGVFKPN